MKIDHGQKECDNAQKTISKETETSAITRRETGETERGQRSGGSRRAIYGDRENPLETYKRYKEDGAIGRKYKKRYKIQRTHGHARNIHPIQKLYYQQYPEAKQPTHARRWIYAENGEPHG